MVGRKVWQLENKSLGIGMQKLKLKEKHIRSERDWEAAWLLLELRYLIGTSVLIDELLLLFLIYESITLLLKLLSVKRACKGWLMYLLAKSSQCSTEEVSLVLLLEALDSFLSISILIRLKFIQVARSVNLDILSIKLRLHIYFLIMESKGESAVEASLNLLRYYRV